MKNENSTNSFEKNLLSQIFFKQCRKKLIKHWLKLGWEGNDLALFTQYDGSFYRYMIINSLITVLYIRHRDLRVHVKTIKSPHVSTPKFWKRSLTTFLLYPRFRCSPRLEQQHTLWPVFMLQKVGIALFDRLVNFHFHTDHKTIAYHFNELWSRKHYDHWGCLRNSTSLSFRVQSFSSLQ